MYALYNMYMYSIIVALQYMCMNNSSTTVHVQYNSSTTVHVQYNSSTTVHVYE